jgi:hypothetical protein
MEVDDKEYRMALNTEGAQEFGGLTRQAGQSNIQAAKAFPAANKGPQPSAVQSAPAQQPGIGSQSQQHAQLAAQSQAARSTPQGVAATSIAQRGQQGGQRAERSGGFGFGPYQADPHATMDSALSQLGLHSTQVKAKDTQGGQGGSTVVHNYYAGVPVSREAPPGDRAVKGADVPPRWGPGVSMAGPEAYTAAGPLQSAHEGGRMKAHDEAYAADPTRRSVVSNIAGAAGGIAGPGMLSEVARGLTTDRQEADW